MSVACRDGRSPSLREMRNGTGCCASISWRRRLAHEPWSTTPETIRLPLVSVLAYWGGVVSE